MNSPIEYIKTLLERQTVPDFTIDVVYTNGQVDISQRVDAISEDKSWIFCGESGNKRNYINVASVAKITVKVKK